MVSLTQDGNHLEVTNQLASTRLYQNLSQDVKFMAFYDVKNAKIMDRRGHEHATQREPLVDMGKFTAFCAIANSLLKAGQGDVVWILAGKTDSNIDKISKTRDARQLTLYLHTLRELTKSPTREATFK